MRAIQFLLLLFVSYSAICEFYVRVFLFPYGAYGAYEHTYTLMAMSNVSFSDPHAPFTAQWFLLIQRVAVRLWSILL